jgi:hypothetical protein
MDELYRTYRNLQKKMRQELFDNFVQDCIIKKDNHSISNNNVFDTFKLWCNYNTIYVSYTLKRELFQDMNKKFCKYENGWKGIDVNDPSIIKNKPLLEHDMVQLKNRCTIIIKYIFWNYVKTN